MNGGPVEFQKKKKKKTQLKFKASWKLLVILEKYI